MKTVKEKIIEQAKRLFNEKGYYHVTMRDIAKDADTTIGNLTYHFPHKEDIVLDIQKDANNLILSDLEKRLEQGSRHHYSLAELFETFILTEKNEQDYSYYFKNLLELARDYPAIQEKQEYNRGVFLRYFQATFSALKSNRILREDVSTDSYHSLARTIVLLMTLWNQGNSPTHEEAFKHHSYLETCSDLIYPLLTKAGQKEHQQFFDTLTNR